MTGSKPSEILNMDDLERRLTMQAAGALEEWRWSNWQKLLGGK